MLIGYGINRKLRPIHRLWQSSIFGSYSDVVDIMKVSLNLSATHLNPPSELSKSLLVVAYCCHSLVIFIFLFPLAPRASPRLLPSSLDVRQCEPLLWRAAFLIGMIIKVALHPAENVLHTHFCVRFVSFYARNKEPSQVCEFFKNST